MTITVQLLYDNSKVREDLEAGWGFSCIIETGGHKILFDTGNDSDSFFSNAQKLQIDLSQITDVVFSHKHKDHTTGSNLILEKLRESARVYVPKGFPLKKIPPYLQVQTIEDFTQIDSDIFSLVLKAGLFLYEQILILKTKKGLVLITGCAHPGIVKIVETVRLKMRDPIHLVLGGFHLFRQNNRCVEKIADDLLSLQVEKIAPCHCSGPKAIEIFHQLYRDFFYEVGVGSCLIIDV